MLPRRRQGAAPAAQCRAAARRAGSAAVAGPTRRLGHLRPGRYRTATNAATTESAAAEASGPFLWRVEGPTPLYLFGTIHVPDDRVLTLPPSVVKAFTDSSAVYTEIPMDTATQMGVMGKVMLPDGSQPPRSSASRSTTG